MQLNISWYTVALKHTWAISRGSWDEETIYKVTLTRDGVSGIGECCTVERYGETDEVILASFQVAREFFADADPWQYRVLEKKLRRMIPSAPARAALEMALLDWIGKTLDLPLYRFWGLSQEDIPLSSYSIGIGSEDEIREKLTEAVYDPILKIKVGTDADEDVLTLIREHTSRTLRLDANEAWQTVDEALQNINKLARFGIEFIEQPMPAGDLDAVAELRRKSPIPIIADEDCHTSADIPQLARAYDGINIKLLKAGGILEAKRMIGLAHTFGLDVMLGCMLETSVGIAAAAHIAPAVEYVDLDSHRLLAEEPYEPIVVENGRLMLKNNPGLGVAAATRKKPVRRKVAWPGKRKSVSASL